MKYILQKDDGVLDLEYLIVNDLLDSSRYVNSKVITTLKELPSLNDIENAIPIGTIDFVGEYLKKFYGIEHLFPIEIPSYLRKDEFLKRDYKIVPYEKLPTNGTIFLKDVTSLKKFGEKVNLDYIGLDTLFESKGGFSELVLDKNHLYQVSSIFPIASEYRVYVVAGEIENIACYNGSCMIFPDANLLKKVVSLINYNEKHLKSYTIDVMVDKNGNTAIIEVHNFASVGLYNTLWGQNLLYAYRDGIDYYINDNRIIKE